MCIKMLQLWEGRRKRAKNAHGWNCYFAMGVQDVNDDKGQVPRVAASAALLAAYAVRTLFNEPLVV